MSDSGAMSGMPRFCLMTWTPGPMRSASRSSATSSSSPSGVRTVVGESSGRPGSVNHVRKCDSSGRSRIVSHGNELRIRPSRTNAQRRSPSTPCQDTNASSSSSPPIDLTG